ncbi:MAG: Protein-L-isoaspartate O-methyltransferase [Alphaproteobacteria bacterium MarineAlpha9_Bin4]|nr:hypothetical protein [Pelagibacterales bacterium]PPR25511.1 MAG: Protein-L-isoaspartate O-methyltransferase [Alphaproteobacteria bacterium MarineAlpha9_Bin4]|tara:strand:- start:35 stop:706 length:672 start_codon:yes stop_codon:yes gene_type:complete
MSTFQKMKENMIQGQFLPGLVKDENLLNIFRKIDRETYLGNNFKHMAYSDIHIRVSNQRYFISPFSLAKILDKSEINSKDVVLLVGSGCGYESAIVSKMASTVMALEENINFFKQAETHLTNNQIDNVMNINGSFLRGCKKYSPYDIIIILGSLEKPSEDLLNQLSDNGKLLVCENYEDNLDESKLFMYTKIKKKILREYVCDLNMPKLTFNIKKQTTFNLES